jgi:hypothetical protein
LVTLKCAEQAGNSWTGANDVLLRQNIMFLRKSIFPLKAFHLIAGLPTLSRIIYSYGEPIVGINHIFKIHP